ncbi:MAG: hypothetical protein ACJ8R9_22780 [Steroidobacteraceae bacterium]
MSAPETTLQLTRPFSWLRLLSHCLVAVLLFVAANVYTYEVSGFFERERLYTQQVSALASHGNVHTLFAGDSHFAVPLNDYLNRDPGGATYSIAAGGDSLRECFAKVRHVLNTTPGIDTLILTADPHMFARGRLESSNRSFADRYFIEAWDRSGVQHNLWSAILQQVPLFSEDFLQYFRKELGVMLTHSAQHARAAGDPLAWSRLTDAQRMKEAVLTGQGDHDGLGDVEEPFRWYVRILDLARARHVRVIGVRFPVHPGYAAQVPADKVAELDSFLLKTGVSQIIDLRDALTDPKDFEDPDHVNEMGAPLVLDMLQQKVQRPLRPATAKHHSKPLA